MGSSRWIPRAVHSGGTSGFSPQVLSAIASGQSQKAIRIAAAETSDRIARKLKSHAVSDEARESLDLQFSGTTACCCVIHDGELVVSNVGDSRAVLGTLERGKVVPKPLSI